jgi:hypothetical protein
VLLNVAVRAITEKRPDLLVKTLSARQDETTGLYTNLVLAIQNLFEDDENKTINADFDGYPSKSFYIDLYIFAPDETSFNRTDNLPPMPFIEGKTEPITPEHHLYTTLPRTAMPAGVTYPSDINDQAVWDNKWKRVDNEQTVSIPSVLASLTKTGTYTACVVVDSYVSRDEASEWKYGYVNEGNETNNFSCIPLEVKTIPVKVCIEPDQPEGITNAKEQDRTTKQPIQGTFTISLSEKLEYDMTVYFNLIGTASFEHTGEGDYVFDQQNGQDVVVQQGDKTAITLPVGAESFQFSFTPIDDTLFEKDETVTIKLYSPVDSPYQVVPVDGTDCQERATILIEENDFGVYMPMIFR